MIPALWRSIDTSVKTLLMVIISCHKAFPYISDIPALTSVMNIMPRVYEILFLTLLCQYFGLVDIRSDESGDLKFLYKTLKLFDWK